MQIWRRTPLDGILLSVSLVHLVVTLWTVTAWAEASLLGRMAILGVLVAMMVYDTIVVAHVFSHSPWFRSRKLNGLASVLCSLNIGQSAQLYCFDHVRNHHVFNNDRVGPDGTTCDTSSTFRGGSNGDHIGVLAYAFGRAAVSFFGVLRDFASVVSWWRVSPADPMAALAAPEPRRGDRELRQVQWDRAVVAIALAAYAIVSPGWFLLAYLPAFYLTLALVNVQNYYEHFGARPRDRYGDSVSHYGHLYNLLTFNDGYHQEHHLRPGAHWRRLPSVRRSCTKAWVGRQRVTSPVPAIVGFLDRRRVRLDRGDDEAAKERLR